MRYSLISRDWIADCVEIMHEAYSSVSSKSSFVSTIAYLCVGCCDQYWRV